MKNAKKWVLVTVLATLGIFVSIMLLNFIVDPLQQYRKASLYQPVYQDSRYLNPGLAKTHDYDTVVIGTSMVQNFRPSEIDALWGSKTVKLPSPGSSAYEQGLVLGTALRTGRVQHVLFGLDVFSFKGAPDSLSRGAGSIPFYLYDDDVINDINYLLSIDTLIFYKYLVRSNYLGKDTKYLDHDNYGYWGDRGTFSEEAVLADWRNAGFNQNAHRDDFVFAKLKDNFDINLLRQVLKHPEVQFDIFFPPYSILVWIDSRQKGLLDELFKFKEYVIATAAGLDNVRVFDFQSKQEIILDLNKYKDISHYTPDINRFIIQSITDGDFLTDPQRYQQKQRELSEMIESHATKYPR